MPIVPTYGQSKLIPISWGPEREINLFIPGLETLDDREKLDSLVHRILRVRPRGKVYLLFWRVYSALGSALTVPQYAQPGKRRKQPQFLPCVEFDVPTLVHVIGKGSLYSSARSYAEELGWSLKQRLSREPIFKRLPINLIGYSLGARVIHYALAVSTWDEFRIQDCIMLAGATLTDPDDEALDWNVSASEIHGRIYNGYSTQDSVLPWIASDAIGNSAIRARNPKIVNHNFRSFDHGDYWDNLESVLSELWPRFRQSKNALVIKRREIECPHCKTTLFVGNDGDYVCQACKLPFELREGYLHYLPRYDVECPHCHLKLSPLPDGEYVCERCEGEFEVRKGDVYYYPAKE
ncbi:DUF726 domain-containing protein [bacterium]|nr:DUF726 domain-containing protein [bacterium]